MRQMYKRAPCNLFHPKRRHNLLCLNKKIFSLNMFIKSDWFGGVTYHHSGTASICKLDRAHIDIAQQYIFHEMNMSVRRCCLHSHPFHHKQPNVSHIFRLEENKKLCLRDFIQKNAQKSIICTAYCDIGKNVHGSR